MSAADLAPLAENSTTPRRANVAQAAYRLLYRGALSLPDSHLLLDGLTFIARLDTPSKHNQLLQNPLALALESMRGRPSLRFMGIVKLHDGNIWWDESAGVELDIHPRATLTRLFFENTFCLQPFASTSASVPLGPTLTSDIGVKVALGDSDGPETTQVMIYARSSKDSKQLDLVVVRLTDRPQPINTSLRLPRPDDPTPRKPPPFYANSTKAKRELVRATSNASVASKQTLKRVASAVLDANSKRKKSLNNDGTTAANLGSGVRVGNINGAEQDDALFKVPDIPRIGITDLKGKRRQIEDDSVFGIADIITQSYSRATGNGKPMHDLEITDAQNSAAIVERVNKDLIKRHTLKYLRKVKDPTIAKVDKSNPEFKDVFGWISRGVGYALRAQMKTRPIDTTQVDQLIDTHAGMYLGGHGGVTPPLRDSDPV